MDANAIPMIASLREIAANYDGAVCDIWGVVHDGRKPNMDAVNALRSFRTDVGPVVLLTNAPRLTSDVSRQFDRIGVPHDCYDVIITSGGAARADLARRTDAARSIRLYHLGPERDRATYEGLNLVLAAPKEAEIVLCTGLFDDERETPDDYRGRLAELKERDLPFICANPDVTVRRGDDVVYCAGALARAYEAIGGKVIAYGKPHRAIFEVALSELRKIAPVQRPLMIGDGLETDIRGANGMDLDALFVSGGLFGVELARLPEAQATRRIGELLARHGVTVSAVIPELRW
jgi:HAD superfamily hydrolase (TIGR01459 family)